MSMTRKEFNEFIPKSATRWDSAYNRILDLISKNPNTAYSMQELSKFLGYSGKYIDIKYKDGHKKKQLDGYSTIRTSINKLVKNKYVEYKRPYIINK